jgi:hypothetical protein
VDPNDCITICWTSGTESRPKGVPRAHYEWLSMSLDTVYSPDLSHKSRVLNPFPMVNMAGINGMLLPWLKVGCVLIQHHPFDLPVFLQQIEEEKITYTVAPAGAARDVVEERRTVGEGGHLHVDPDRIRVGPLAGVDGARLVRALRHRDHQLLRIQRRDLAHDRRQVDDPTRTARQLLSALRR